MLYKCYVFDAGSTDVAVSSESTWCGPHEVYVAGWVYDLHLMASEPSADHQLTLLFVRCDWAANGNSCYAAFAAVRQSFGSSRRWRPG